MRSQKRGGWLGRAGASSFLVFFFAAHTSSVAQNLPLDPALQHAVETHKKIIGEAQQYAYTERLKAQNFDSKGKVTSSHTERYEIIFLEGAPYQKHILHNDQPLDEKEQKAEDKKLQDVAKARREQKDKHSLFHASFQFEFPLDQLATRFDVSSNGSEVFDGRKSLLFTAIPKAGSDLKQAAHDGVAYEMKFWVDDGDHVFHKIEGKVVAEGMRYGKDSLISYEWSKVNNEAWLPVRFWFKGQIRYLLQDIPDETEQTYSDYKKFRADSKVLTE